MCILLLQPFPDFTFVNYFYRGVNMNVTKEGVESCKHKTIVYKQIG